MPNIFKNFLKPAFDNYVFPDAEELEVEEDEPVPPEPPPEPEEPEAEEEPAEPEPSSEPQSGAEALISYARIQADEIMADARRRGDALLEQMRQEAQAQLDAEREEARDAGYRQGYGEGLAQGRQDAAAQTQEQLRQEAGRVEQFLTAATAAREELLEGAREELCDLSLAIAEKVIHVSLRSSREVVARMIQVATEKLKRREWVHVYVGGCEAKDVAQIAPQLTAALSGLSDHIKIIPMAGDEEGTCIIEMPDEIIDASASTQLNNIRDLLHGG